ncbi:MAG: hypothetical protein EXR77_16980 [Myxococcales bacterium]|nr:hypothetical protein [Myxococcales bacterium]
MPFDRLAPSPEHFELAAKFQAALDDCRSDGAAEHRRGEAAVTELLLQHGKTWHHRWRNSLPDFDNALRDAVLGTATRESLVAAMLRHRPGNPVAYARTSLDNRLKDAKRAAAARDRPAPTVAIDVEDRGAVSDPFVDCPEQLVCAVSSDLQQAAFVALLALQFPNPTDALGARGPEIRKLAKEWLFRREVLDHDVARPPRRGWDAAQRPAAVGHCRAWQAEWYEESAAALWRVDGEIPQRDPERSQFYQHLSRFRTSFQRAARVGSAASAKFGGQIPKGGTARVPAEWSAIEHPSLRGRQPKVDR